MVQQKKKIQINKKYNPSERMAIAQDVLDYIVDRTQKGISVNGKSKFPKYSKEYKKSLDFKNAGKTSKVDLTLSGDMLASMELLTQRRGSITIGFEAGTEENDKAEGNQLGSYGQPRPNPSKARKFVGISDNALNKILKKYPIRDAETRLESVRASMALAKLADDLIDNLKLKKLSDD